MREDAAAAKDLDALSARVSDFLKKMRSVEELADWLRSQPRITSVTMSDYVVKTEPPQQEFLVTFRMPDGPPVTKVVDVILYPDGSYGLGGIHNS